MASSRIGLLYSPEFLNHDTGSHPEHAGRLKAVMEAVRDLPLEPVEPRPATDEELLWLHTPEHLERVKRVCAAGGGFLDPDTPVSRASEGVARLAVGGVMELVRRVVEGELERGFAAVRPPGHHATPDRAMGFCIYSTVALAARYCRECLGLSRVFLFDWDVHHGNGSQDCLYDDPTAYYASFHQFPFYPGTGRVRERGVGEGRGCTLNLPLPAGMGDEDYLWAVDRLLEPVVLDYEPELILVSAGYDAHREDPLGGMRLSTEGFRSLARRLARLGRRTAARGRLVGVLEGGYHPRRLAESVRATCEAWLEEDPEEPPVPEERVHRECRRAVEEALRTL